MPHIIGQKSLYSIDCRAVAPAVALVRKLTAVLESIEKLPVFSYDSSTSGYGLQVYARLFKQFIIEVRMEMFNAMNT